MKLATYKRLPYPQNLWSTILERKVLESQIPTDWEATLSFLFKTMPGHEASALELFFRHYCTDKKISAELGVAAETARTLIRRGILRLRNRYRLQILMNGFGKYTADCEAKKKESFLAASISTLDAPQSVLQCLQSAGIQTIGDLISQKKSYLLTIPTVGEASIDKIASSLAVIGLSFDSEPSPALITPISPDEGIETLHMANRVTNALRRAGIFTVGQLTATTYSNLRGIRGIGYDSRVNICIQMERFGLSLAPETEEEARKD